MKINKKIFITIMTIFVFMFTINSSHSQLLNTVVALTGNVFDAVTKKAVTVFLIVQDSDGNKVQATRSSAFENGYYYLTGLKPGRKYTIILRKQNYFIEKYEIDIANSDKYEEISHDFLIKPMYIGAKIPLPVPPFELNKSKLRFGSDMFLSDISNTLKYNPKVKVEIRCYPDNNKSKQENDKLTMGRCESLKNFFSKNGVDPMRLSIKSDKNTDPDNPPPTQTQAKGKRYIGSSYIVVKTIK